MTLISVHNLSVEFSIEGQWLPAVDGVSFDVEKGEILAIVGESGCGKSVTCMSLTRLLPEPPARYASGKITYHDEKGTLNVLEMSGRELRKIRGGKIAYVFQEPSVSLNPVFRVGDQIAESILLHRPDVTDVMKEVVQLLRKVGIPDAEERSQAYPHEMSGGMQQRVMIAMALASSPELLIADEPTTALDVTIQAQILELLSEIRKTTGMAIILITHNLGIVSELADRVIVMYAGHTVESATAREIIDGARHPYTEALLSAVPKLAHKEEALTTIPGTVPTPANYPAGCRFYGRCPLAAGLPQERQSKCAESVPPWRSDSVGHWNRCWYT